MGLCYTPAVQRSSRAYPAVPEGYAMAHREQHGNRETKKPKKEKPKAEVQPNKWAVSNRLSAKAQRDH